MPQQAKVSTIPGSVPHHNNHNKQGVSERVIQDHPQVITYVMVLHINGSIVLNGEPCVAEECKFGHVL